MKKHLRHENDCLNCGAELQGHFCHECGQENLELKDDFGHLMVHAIGDYFHFDEKFIHTYKPLLFSPGKLTIDYMAGKRTQYLHPMRMYIFISVVYFLLLFGHSNKEENVVGNVKDKKEVAAGVNKILDKKLTPAQKALANGHVTIGGLNTQNQPVASINIGEGSDKDTSYQQYIQRQQKLPEAKRDGFVEKYFAQKSFEWKSKGLTPQKAITESFGHNFPKMMFFMLPVFALMLKVAFRKNHKYYMEHLILAFHLHCFVFLYLLIMLLIKMVLPSHWIIIGSTIDVISFLVILFYTYRTLRVVYKRSRLATLIKIISVGITYSLVFVVGIVLYVIVLAAFA